jgi:hypothetical protein
MKGKAILREIDNMAEIKNCKVEDGNLVIGKREFIVDLEKTKINPVWVKKFPFGFVPYFDLKWNCIVPSSFERKDTKISETGQPVFVKRELVPTEHKFLKTELPEALKETNDWRFLKELKHYGAGEKKKISAGKIAIVFGLIMFFVFILMSGIIKF